MYYFTQRAYSTKTRIKTIPIIWVSQYVSFSLREHIPLKQGLRPSYPVIHAPSYRLREHIPLKQGLRHSLTCHSMPLATLREHIPLKQGLRQEYEKHAYHQPQTQRAYSTKTRIKTFLLLLHLLFLSESIFH